MSSRWRLSCIRQWSLRLKRLSQNAQENAGSVFNWLEGKKLKLVENLGIDIFQRISRVYPNVPLSCVSIWMPSDNVDIVRDDHRCETFDAYSKQTSIRTFSHINHITDLLHYAGNGIGFRDGVHYWTNFLQKKKVIRISSSILTWFWTWYLKSKFSALPSSQMTQCFGGTFECLFTWPRKASLLSALIW